MSNIVILFYKKNQKLKQKSKSSSLKQNSQRVFSIK